MFVLVLGPLHQFSFHLECLNLHFLHILHDTKETIPTKDFDLMIENYQSSVQAFEEMGSSTDDKDVNKSSGRLLSL